MLVFQLRHEHQLWRDEVDAMTWAYRDAGMLPPSKQVYGDGVDVTDQDPSMWGWPWIDDGRRHGRKNRR